MPVAKNVSPPTALSAERYHVYVKFVIVVRVPVATVNCVLYVAGSPAKNAGLPLWAGTVTTIL